MEDIVELKADAINGDLQVSKTLALMYENGNEVEQNFHEAAVWWLNVFSLSANNPFSRIDALNHWKRCMKMTGKNCDDTVIPDLLGLQYDMAKCLEAAFSQRN